MILVANWLAEGKWLSRWQAFRSDRLSIWLVLYYAVYAVSLLYSENKEAGLFILEKKLLILAFPLCMVFSPPLTDRELKRILKVFVFSCLLASILCIGVAVKLNYQEGHTISYLYNALVNDIHLPGQYNYFNYWYFTYKLLAASIHMHPVYLSMYVIFASAAAIWMWWEQRRHTKLLFFLLAFNFIFIVLLSSRTQIFCAMVLITVFWLTQAHKKSKLGRGIVMVVLFYSAGIGMVLLNPVIRERIIVASLPGNNYADNKYGEGGMSLRIYKWKYAAEAFKMHPLFGAGSGDGQDELLKVYKEHDFTIGVLDNFNPHNQFLQSAVDTGVVGLLVLMMVFVSLAQRAFKAKNALFLLFVGLFFVSCLTESMLEVNKGVAFFSFFSAIIGISYLRSPAKVAVQAPDRF